MWQRMHRRSVQVRDDFVQDAHVLVGIVVDFLAVGGELHCLIVEAVCVLYLL